jgi:transcriptional regulator with XRE-family HTH domain
MLELAKRTVAVFPRGMTASDAAPATEQQLLGRALKLLRKAAGMTQAEAAEAYGCEPGSWRRYEAGARDLSFDQLKALAEAVGSTREELVRTRDDLASGRPARHGMAEAPRPFAAAELRTGSASRRQAVFNLEEGDVVVTYPSELSAASRRELADYLALLLRRFSADA